MFSPRRIAIIVAVIGIISMLAPQRAVALNGEKTFGLETGFVSKNSSMEVGLFFQYAFSERFRLAPHVDCVFRHKDLDAFVIDVDAHVPFGISGKNVGLYPIAGVNFSSWDRHNVVPSMTDDVSTRQSRFGINAGAGVDLKVTQSMKINFEIKYNIIKQYSSVKMSVGIAYVF